MAASQEDIVAKLKALALSKQTKGQAVATHEESQESKDLTKQAAMDRLKSVVSAEKQAGVTLKQREEASKEALETPYGESFVSRGLIDLGRAGQRTPQGLKVLDLEAEQKRLQRVISGEQEPVSLGFGEEVNYSAPSFQEREQAKIDLDRVNAELDDITSRLSREEQTYRMGTEGREAAALVGDLLGTAIFEPAPGVGQLKTGSRWIDTLKSFTGRASKEGAINAVYSGLEYAPEGVSREEQMITSMLFGGILRGGLDAVTPRVSNFLNKMRDNRFSREEIAELKAIVERDYPEIAGQAKMMTTMFDDDFISKQLSVNFTPEQIDAMPKTIQERLAVFTYMESKPTMGQVFRDADMMDKERAIAGTEEGKEIRDFFTEQRERGEAKILEVTGNRKAFETGEMDLGADVKNTFDSIAGDWADEWHVLYDMAAKNTDPEIRFNLDAMASAIIKNRNNLAGSSGEQTKNAMKNVIDMVQQRLDIPDAEIKTLRDGFKAQHSHEAMIDLAILDQLIQRKGGINAIEGNEILKQFNAIPNPSAMDKMIIKDIREGLLVDTVHGTGTDAFKGARDSFSGFYKTIKDFPIAERLGLTVSDTGAPQWSEQDVARKLLGKNGKIEDFRAFMSLLDQDRFADVAPQIKESMREYIFSQIRKGSFKGPLKAGDADNVRSLSPKQFISTLDSLYERGGKERVESLLTDEERSALAVVRRYAQLLEEPAQEGFRARNPSGTAIQHLAGALVFLNRNPMLHGIARAGAALNSDLADAITYKKSMQGMRVPEMLEQANRPPPVVDQMYRQMVGSSVPPSFARAYTRGEENEQSQKSRLAEEIVRRNSSVR